MKKARVFNILSLVFNVAIVGLVAFAVLTKLLDQIMVSVFYFEVIAAALVALASLIAIPFNIIGIVKGKKLPRPIVGLKMFGAISETVVLGAAIGFFGVLMGKDIAEIFGGFFFQDYRFLLRLVVPALAIISYAFLDHSKKRFWLFSLFPFLVPAAYEGAYVLNFFKELIKIPVDGAETADWYKLTSYYDSMDKVKSLIIALAIIAVAALVLSIVFYIINRLMSGKDVVEEVEEEEVLAEIPAPSEEKEEEVVLAEPEEEKVEEEPAPEVKEEPKKSAPKKAAPKKEEAPKEEEPKVEEAPKAEEAPKEEEKVEEAPKADEPKKAPAKKPAAKKDEAPKAESNKKDSAKKPAAAKADEGKKKDDAPKASGSKEGGTKVYHLTKRKEDGMWAITFVGGQKAVKLFKTKKEAEAALKVLTENQGATALIRNSKGAKAGKFASSIKASEDEKK